MVLKSWSGGCRKMCQGKVSDTENLNFDNKNCGIRCQTEYGVRHIFTFIFFLFKVYGELL